MKKGLIISFEGIDGCGKSTQAKLFEKYLKENGEKTILLYEPGGTVIGEKIRKLLLNNKSNIDKWTELFLYLASRSQLLQEKIKKEKDSGSTVILDRYIYSTIAYQGYGRGISEKLIMTIHKYFIDKYFPDITFVIDVKPESVISVLNKKKKDRIENESIQFQRKVREGYLKISKSLNNVNVIKRKTVQKTHMEIIETWEKFKDEYRRY